MLSFPLEWQNLPAFFSRLGFQYLAERHGQPATDLKPCVEVANTSPNNLTFKTNRVHQQTAFGPPPLGVIKMFSANNTHIPSLSLLRVHTVAHPLRDVKRFVLYLFRIQTPSPEMREASNIYTHTDESLLENTYFVWKTIRRSIHSFAGAA